MIKAFQDENIPLSSVCAAVVLYKTDFQDQMLIVSCRFLQKAIYKAMENLFHWYVCIVRQASSNKLNRL